MTFTNESDMHHFSSDYCRKNITIFVHKISEEYHWLQLNSDTTFTPDRFEVSRPDRKADIAIAKGGKIAVPKEPKKSSLTVRTISN